VSTVLLQFVKKLHSVWSCEQFCIQRLPEQRQIWWRTNCCRPAVPECGRTRWETSTADDCATGTRNSPKSGRRRTKSSTCVNLRNSLQLFRQVLRCWTVKAAVGEYRHPKRDTVSNPQPLKMQPQWTDERSRIRAACISRPGGPAAFWTHWILSTRCCGRPKSTVLPLQWYWCGRSSTSVWNLHRDVQWFYVAVREIQCMRATLLQKGNYLQLRELFNVGK